MHLVVDRDLSEFAGMPAVGLGGEPNARATVDGAFWARSRESALIGPKKKGRSLGGPGPFFALILVPPPLAAHRPPTGLGGADRDECPAEAVERHGPHEAREHLRPRSDL